MRRYVLKVPSLNFGLVRIWLRREKDLFFPCRMPEAATNPPPALVGRRHAIVRPGTCLNHESSKRPAARRKSSRVATLWSRQMSKRKGNREVRKPKQVKKDKVQATSVSQLSARSGPAAKK